MRVSWIPGNSLMLALWAINKFSHMKSACEVSALYTNEVHPGKHSQLDSSSSTSSVAFSRFSPAWTSFSSSSSKMFSLIRLKQIIGRVTHFGLQTCKLYYRIHKFLCLLHLKKSKKKLRNYSQINWKTYEAYDRPRIRTFFWCNWSDTRPGSFAECNFGKKLNTALWGSSIGVCGGRNLSTRPTWSSCPV